MRPENVELYPEPAFWVYSATGEPIGYGTGELPDEMEIYFPGGDEVGYAGAIVNGAIELSSGVIIGSVKGNKIYDDEGSLVATIHGEQVLGSEGELLASVPGDLSNEARGGAALLLAWIRRDR